MITHSFWSVKEIEEDKKIHCNKDCVANVCVVVGLKVMLLVFAIDGFCFLLYMSRPEFGNPSCEGIRQANPVLLLINFKEKCLI